MLKILKLFIITLLILIATVGGAALKIIEEMRIDLPPPIPNNGEYTDVVQSSAASFRTDPLLGTTNILFVGVDQRTDRGIADAIVLAFFDIRGEAIGLLSIPRDSRVQIPGRRWDKIGHAFSTGGVSLLRETLTNLTNVTINYHVVFNLRNFPPMIDLIGGVDMYVERPMRYTDHSQRLFINIPRGQQRFDGINALHFARFRSDPLGDIGRIQRQQRLMSAVLDELRNPLIVPRIPSIIREVISAINTDLTPLEAIQLITYAITLEQGSVSMNMAPGRAAHIGGVSYWVIDPVEMSTLIPQLIAGREDSAHYAEAEAHPLPSALSNEDTLDLIVQIGRISVLNGDGTRGLARRASQVFQRIGIDVPFTGDARHFGFERSNIIYPSERYRPAAEALARLSGITNMGLVRRDSSARMVSIILGRDKETIFNRLGNSMPMP